MTQRGLMLLSLLELIAVSRPPTLETELEGSKDLEVRSAVKADPVLPTGSTCVQ